MVLQIHYALLHLEFGPETIFPPVLRVGFPKFQRSCRLSPPNPEFLIWHRNHQVDHISNSPELLGQFVLGAIASN